MKIGLYSITYLGVWYRGGALTLEQLIERAREYGYDGVEIDGKRPHGNPIDLPKYRCAELRARANAAAINIYAVAANNDFSSPIPEHRESQLAYVRDLIRMTADLGAPVLRIFAAWPGITMSANGGTYELARRLWASTHDVAPAEAWERCREGLVEASGWAADHGITLALQNHPPVINNFDDMTRMIREVGSPALRACFDAPLARKQGTADMRRALTDLGPLQVLTHFGGEYDEDAAGCIRGFVRRADGGLDPEDFYREFVRGLLDIGYEGYIGYELCHPLPKIDGRTVGMDFADRNAKLAADYMRGMIDELRLAGIGEPSGRA